MCTIDITKKISPPPLEDIVARNGWWMEYGGTSILKVEAKINISIKNIVE